MIERLKIWGELGMLCLIAGTAGVMMVLLLYLVVEAIQKLVT